jgi:hypothetical protein
VRPSLPLVAATFAAVVGLSILAYAPMLGLPFIADDYVQIGLARDYGPVSGWSALMADPLYRSRATSLVLTYWLERAAGLNPVYYHLAGLALHVLNGLLVFALGGWKPVGWPVAALAAGFFAVSQRHSEAVVWFAALPELLVFACVLGGLLCWLGWLRAGGRVAYAAALVLFAAALLSKESGVALIPLAALAVAADPESRWKKLWGVAPMAALGCVYFALIYAARAGHLHFGDGTFSLDAPFLRVLVVSGSNLLWLWGVPALAALLWLAPQHLRRVAWLGGAWILATLAPYSFLTYMTRVPSRHAYLASAGLALMVGAGLTTVARRFPARRWIAPALAAAMILEEAGYLWLVKKEHYTLRAQPTEMLLERARLSPGPLYANCFPYSPWVAEYTLRVHGFDTSQVRLAADPEAAAQPDAADYCNDAAQGVRYSPPSSALR